MRPFRVLSAYSELICQPLSLFSVHFFQPTAGPGYVLWTIGKLHRAQHSPFLAEPMSAHVHFAQQAFVFDHAGLEKILALGQYRAKEVLAFLGFGTLSQFSCSAPANQNLIIVDLKDTPVSASCKRKDSSKFLGDQYIDPFLLCLLTSRRSSFPLVFTYIFFGVKMPRRRRVLVHPQTMQQGQHHARHLGQCAALAGAVVQDGFELPRGRAKRWSVGLHSYSYWASVTCIHTHYIYKYYVQSSSQPAMNKIKR